MSISQPTWKDASEAHVRGRAWPRDVIVPAVADFVRRFWHRFPGQSEFLIRDGPIVTRSPEALGGDFLDELRELITSAMNSPLESLRYVLRSGRYKCEIFLMDEIPHYHPDTKHFHRANGDPFPHEVSNTPTIRITSRASVELKPRDDTDELRIFLASTAAQIGFTVTGERGEPHIDLVPDGKKVMSLRREMSIHYRTRQPGERCRPQGKQGSLFSPKP